jgi:predicted nicotinamide N-methyase
VLDDLVAQSVDLPSGELRLLQPEESAQLPDRGPVEWAPIAPYWSVLWRSGVALARELDREELDGKRVVELGCGLGVPSLVAARAGADVLATDGDSEALELLTRNAQANDLQVETATIDWADAGALVARGPFDLALAADVLYEPESVDLLLALFPRLAPKALLAVPGRPEADRFVDRARDEWRIETETIGAIHLHHLTLA